MKRMFSLLLLAMLLTSAALIFNVEISEAPLDSDFSISISPTTQIVAPGEDTFYEINISASDPTPAISLSITGLPLGVTYLFDPSSLYPNGTSSLMIDCTVINSKWILSFDD